MWAEIEVEDYRGRTLRLRYEEAKREWSAVGESVKLSTAGEIVTICNDASGAIPAADSRMARTAAKRAIPELAKHQVTNYRPGKLIALGEWPWPEGWWPETEEERRLREKGIIVA